MNVQPKCPVFGDCGGCFYQDKDYSLQIELKKKDIRETFGRVGIEVPADIKVFFNNEYYYRNRMDFVFSKNGPGFRKRGKFNRVVNFDKCHISNIGINHGLSKTIEWFNKHKEQLDIFDLDKNTGTLRYATIRSSFRSSVSRRPTRIVRRCSSKSAGRNASR